MSKLLALLALSVLLVGCAPESHQLVSATPTIEAVPELVAVVQPPRPFTFAVAGDSLTAWDSTAFPAVPEVSAPQTWLATARTATSVLVGGWAVAGARADAIRDHIGAVDADVLIILAGTNNVVQEQTVDGEAIAAVGRLIEEMVVKSGINVVVITALPPFPAKPDVLAAHNVALEQLALFHGWAFVDPWASIRDGDNWAVGYSDDGVHSNAAGAAVAGPLMVAAARLALNDE